MLADCYRFGYSWDMKEKFPNGLKAAMSKAAIGSTKLAKLSGTSKQNISRWADGERRLVPEWAEKLAPLLDTTADKLLLINPMETGSFSVPIMGFIGAGGEIMPEYEQVPPEGLDQIDLPFPVPPEIIALGVKGISMMPAYKDGDAVLVWKDQRMATEHYLGEEAAVRTHDGRRFLKELQRGSSRGAYNLHSYNAPLIENVGIEWVGEIYLTVKAPVIRRMAQNHRATITKRQNRIGRETDGMDELPLDKRA